MSEVDLFLEQFGMKHGKPEYNNETKERQEKTEVNNKQIAWPADVLPVEDNTNISDIVYLAELESALSEASALIKHKKKLANLLHTLDIELVKNVTAKDLIAYDGKNIPRRIAYLINKNTGLLNWATEEMSFKQLLKMIEYFLVLRSFNNLSVFVKAAQTKRLSTKRIKQLSEYKEYLDKLDGGVFPFEWMLRDSAESNINMESEIAARRFCKIIEKLKEMKMLEGPVSLKKKYKLQILSKIWIYMGNNNEENREENQPTENKMLYLVL